VVLYELLTGERLFNGEDASETMAQVLAKQLDFARVPTKAQRLLRLCLEKDPKLRLRDIGDAKQLLEEPASGASRRTRRTRMVKIFKCAERSRSSMMDVEDEHNHMRAAFGLRDRIGQPGTPAAE